MFFPLQRSKNYRLSDHLLQERLARTSLMVQDHPNLLHDRYESAIAMIWNVLIKLNPQSPWFEMFYAIAMIWNALRNCHDLKCFTQWPWFGKFLVNLNLQSLWFETYLKFLINLNPQSPWFEMFQSTSNRNRHDLKPVFSF